MVTHFTTRPTAAEYDPEMARYMALVPAGDLVEILRRQGDEMRALLAPLDDVRAAARFAPGKWTVKQVLGHVMDAERVFAYRALRIGRGDRTPLPGYEDDDYIATGGFERRPIADLVEEMASIRGATVTLFASFDASAWLREGTANGHPISVRALGCDIVGHERYHANVLREKYGLGFPAGAPPA